MVDWAQIASDGAAALEVAAEPMIYERIADGARFTVPGVPAKPGARDLTGGANMEQQKIRFAPAAFLAASGGVRPVKGDLVTFGGREYAIASFAPRRIGGVEMAFIVFTEG